MRFLGAVLAGALMAVTATAMAQTWPSKPIKIVVPFTAGSTGDLEARAIGNFMEPHLKQPVIVEPKPGAGSAIGVEAVAKAPPDGYTFLFTGSSVAQLKLLRKDLGFDPMKDLVPVSLAGEVITVFAVNKDVPAKTWPEFVAYARANPGKYNYGSLGRGSTVLGMEAIKAAAGFNLTEIPFGGQVPAITALLRNDVQATLAADGMFKQHVDAGNARVIMAIGTRRTPLMPDAPTSTELGFGDRVRSFAWSGLFAPAGTPQAIIDRVAAEVAAYAKDPEALKRAATTGYSLIGSTPQEFKTLLDADEKAWTAIAKAINLQPE